MLPNDITARYVNTFITPTKQVVVVIEKFIFVLNEKLEDIKTISPSEFFPEKNLRSFDEALDESKFFMSFFYQDCDIYKYKYKVLESRTGVLVCKAVWNSEKISFDVEDVSKGSLWVQGLNIRYVREYFPNKLLIQIGPQDLAFVDNWQVTKRIKDSASNTLKNQTFLFPNFSEELPLILISGMKYLGVINVNLRTIQPIVDVSLRAYPG